MKLEINQQKKWETTDYMEIKQCATEKPMHQQGNQKGNQKKIPQDKWSWRHNHSKSMGCHKSSAQREVHSNTGLSPKRRKISNGQFNPPPQCIRKRRTRKT